MNSRESVFRPCIDLHDGVVKQIVGGSLSERDPSILQTNFVSRLVFAKLPLACLKFMFKVSTSDSPANFAQLYKDNDLKGGHVVKLGSGNDEAAKAALNAWPS
jgi:phosphoribosylformimino-5-aminoimidazole carboxamide ribotide isomerase